MSDTFIEAAISWQAISWQAISRPAVTEQAALLPPPPPALETGPSPNLDLSPGLEPPPNLEPSQAACPPPAETAGDAVQERLRAIARILAIGAARAVSGGQAPDTPNALELAD